MRGERDPRHLTATPADWQTAREELGDGVLSIIMPAHNLGESIADNIREVADYFAGRLPFEILVVDDGSSDDTRDRVEEAAARVPNTRAVLLSRNAGKGAALRQGFEASKGRFILMLDGDLELSPAQVPIFFRILREKRADIVIGSKRHPQSQLAYPWYRVLISNVYYGLVKALVGLPVRDTQTGMKLFRRDALGYVLSRMLVKRFAFDLEILAIAHDRGFRIAEAPVVLDFRSGLGCLRPVTVKHVLIDTLAIAYRLKVLHYYQTIRDARMPDRPPTVSVLIAFPSVTPYLEECLEGLRLQKYRNFDVLLLPDEATGRTWGPNTREIPTGRIRPAEKRNIGIREAAGEIVAFLDDDTIPSEEWLQRAVPHFSDGAVGAVGGPATTPPSDPYAARIGGAVYSNRLVSGNYRYRYEADRVREVDDFPSCNLLVRTELLRQLSGFRTDFWPGEDTYLCQQLTHGLGRKIIYDPWVHVFHHRRRLLLPHLRQIGRYALHRGYFAKRFPATSRRVSYALPSLLAMGIAAGACVSVAWPAFRPVYAAGVSAYLVLMLLGSFPLESFVTSLRLDLRAWLLVWLGIVSTHLVYGVRFLQGLLTRRLPGAVERFDHPSEQKSAPSTTGEPRARANAGGDPP